MASIQLSLAIDANLRTAGLISGEVRAEGIDLQCSSELRGPKLFRHQLKTREFDICDMSLTSVFMMIDRGDTSFVPIPVFTMRHFFHTTTLVRENAGIDKPEDLKGKRLGIPGYQSAASLWCRGALEHEFGVSPYDVEWFTQQMADASSGEIVFDPPKGLRLNAIEATDSIGQMLLDGRIDAYINVLRPAPELLAQGCGIRRLFPDSRTEGIRYYRATGLYPTNHCVVINREVVDRYPWVPLNIFKAFLESSNRAKIPVKALDPYIETGYLEPEARDVFSKDLFGYGIESEELVLKTFGQYCYEQGYTSQALRPHEVYSHTEWT